MKKAIGRFEVVRELGRGAQSVVYLGFDPQLEREVALKTLHFTNTDPDRNRQLLAEARMVSKLRHANVVPIYEAGEDDGELYLVFEYVPGGSLEDVIKEQGALAPVKAVTLQKGILDAIAHAHAQGLIHRDLKPSNILVDENGIPRVMDFGIAARVGGISGNDGDYSGTPAYMAPEYVDRREITPKGDIFSAGLVLFEMLTGQRAIAGDNLFQVMHKVANEDIRLPAGVGVDERLAAILYKALARQPSLRYETAQAFSVALENYLDPSDGNHLEGDGRQSTLDFLLRRMRHKSDFPALSESVSAINKIAISETESVNKLSDTILRDFALTNKLLRLVNSAYFRPAGGGSISTVSRAVIVLGFEAVRNIAISVLLFEHLQNKGNANQLKEEFLRANLAGILARDLCTAAQGRELEQTFICALFHSLGRVLSQYYFPEECDEIRRVVGQKKVTDDQAAIQVLGISFEEIGIAIAKQWGFPPLIVNTMRRLPPGGVKKPVNVDERLQVMAGVSNELCEVIVQSTPESRSKEMRRVLARFGDSVPVSEKDIHDTMLRSIEEASDFARIIHLNLQQTTFGRQMRQFSTGGGATGEGGDAAQKATPSDPYGDTILHEDGPLGYGGEEEVPLQREDAQSVLTAGIQDISNTLVDGFKLNDILRIILETMYRAMGFKRVILCIKDGKANAMQGRFGFGYQAPEIARQFRFSLTFTPDIFHAATSKGVDILISDVNDPKISARIPNWYRQLIPARSFVVFPLNIKNNPVAMIYADQDGAGQIVISEKELSLLRTLRNQAILAIKQGS